MLWSINTCLPGNLRIKEVNKQKDLIKHKIEKLAYCNGNVGNTVITESFYQIGFNKLEFFYRKLIKISNLDESISNKDLLKNKNILLNLQDCIKIDPYLTKKEFENLTDIILNSKNIFIYSLGCNVIGEEDVDLEVFYNSLPKFIINFIDAIFHHKNCVVLVRDEFTKKLIEFTGKSSKESIINSGCPSVLAINTKYAKRKLKRNLKKINMNPYPLIGGLAGSNCQLILENSKLIVQEPHELIVGYYDLDQEVGPTFPFYKKLYNFLKDEKKIFMPLTKNKWLKRINNSQSNIYVGTRMHGSIMALTCGVPGILLSNDLRVSKYCKQFYYPHKPGSGESIESFFNEVISHDWDQTFMRIEEKQLLFKSYWNQFKKNLK